MHGFWEETILMCIVCNRGWLLGFAGWYWKWVIFKTTDCRAQQTSPDTKLGHYNRTNRWAVVDHTVALLLEPKRVVVVTLELSRYRCKRAQQCGKDSQHTNRRKIQIPMVNFEESKKKIIKKCSDYDAIVVCVLRSIEQHIAKINKQPEITHSFGGYNILTWGDDGKGVLMKKMNKKIKNIGKNVLKLGIIHCTSLRWMGWDIYTHSIDSYV